MEIDGVLVAILVSDGKELGSPLLNQLGGDMPFAQAFYRVSDLGVKDFEIRSFKEPSSWVKACTIEYLSNYFKTPTVKKATCEEVLIGNAPLRPTEVDGAKKQFETACAVKDSLSKFSKVRVLSMW